MHVMQHTSVADSQWFNMGISFCHCLTNLHVLYIFSYLVLFLVTLTNFVLL